MKVPSTTKRLAGWAAAIWLSLALAGCGNGIDVAEWTEEVLLHDGRSITVWRKATRKSGGFPEPRGAYVSFELKYEPMGVHWVGPPTRDLLSFDLIQGVPWIATSLRERATCVEKKKTDFNAAFYKWMDGQWVEVSAEAYPIRIARENLWGRFSATEAKDDAKGHIPWLRKQHLTTPPISIYEFLTTHSQYCSIYQ